MTSGAAISAEVQAAARALLEQPKLALDRAPVLQGVFERLASLSAEALRAVCTPPCTLMLNGLSAGNTWDLVEPYEDGFGGIYYAPDWDARLILGCDRRFVFSFVEAMFGGDGTEPPFEGDRPFSAIEIRSIKQIIGLAASALQTLFAPIGRTSFVLERVETRLDFSTLGVADAPAVMATFIAQVLDGGGRMFVLMPQSALAPFRRRLEREPPPETPHHDPVWARQLLSEVGRAEVQLRAVLDGPNLTLLDVTQLQVGRILKLQATTDSLLTAESEGRGLFRCRLGQSKGLFTVRIEQHIDEQQELLSEIISGHGRV